MCSITKTKGEINMYQKFIFTKLAHLKKSSSRRLLKAPRRFSSGLVSPYTPLFSNKNIQIRNMTLKDLHWVTDLIKKEGWNPGRYEEEALYAADPKGYFLLEVDGKPAASLAAIKYSEKLAFLGLFVVVEQYRKTGLGRILWDVAMGHIKECSSIGLNGVLTQVERYKKDGFYPSFTNTRWKGKPINIPSEKGLNNETVSLTDRFSLETLIKYDNGIFSTPREAFLTKWLAMPESHTLAALDKEGNICGYGVISRTEDGYKIAPLFANSEVIANQLYRNLTHFVGLETDVYFDTCEANPYASSMMKYFKQEKIFDTLQMYRGEPRKGIDYDKMPGLTSLHIF